jgi:hypothetical protein
LIDVADEATLDALTVVQMLTPEEQALKQQYEARLARKLAVRQALEGINLAEATTVAMLKAKLAIIADALLLVIKER